MNKVGEKKYCQEKVRITIILGITEIGTKLPPYFIFKGNEIVTRKIRKSGSVK